MTEYSGIFYSKTLDIIVHILSYRLPLITSTYNCWIIRNIYDNELLWDEDGFDTNIEEVYDLIDDSDIIENIADTKYIISRIVHELELEEIEMICKIDIIK